MKKTTLYLVTFLVLSLATLAYENQSSMCSGTISLNQNCTMITPTLYCGDYTYRIINTTGGLLENGSLTQLNDTIYYFNFTRTNESGKYLVVLCDGTTREVFVDEGGNNVIPGILMIIPLVIGTFCLLGSFFLGEEHKAFKIFLFLFSFIPFFVSLHIGMLNLIHFYNYPELQTLIGTTTYWFAIIVGVIITYFLIYLVATIIHNIAQKRQESEVEY